MRLMESRWFSEVCTITEKWLVILKQARIGQSCLSQKEQQHHLWVELRGIAI